MKVVPKFQNGGSSIKTRQEYIDNINDWALANPTRVFDADFRQQRQYLRDDVWQAISHSLTPEGADKYYKEGKLPEKYQTGGPLTQQDKNRLWKLNETMGANDSQQEYFNYWKFQKGDSEVRNYFNSYLDSPGFKRIINNQNE